MADDANSSESPDKLRGLISERSNAAVAATVENIILKNGYGHVSPDDFKGASYDDLESLPEKVKSLNDQREAAGREAMKQMLAERGVEDVDGAVDQLLTGSPVETDTPAVDSEAIARARVLGGVGGGVVTQNYDHLKDDGMGMMTQYFREQDAKTRK